jgi:type VI secretion system secreted protein VgrG
MTDSLGALASSIVENLAGTFTQHRRVLRLSAPGAAESLLAETLRGDEEIGRGFRLQVTALSLDADIPLKSLIGQPVLLELQTTTAQPRPFHGHVTAAELTGANGGFARYQLTVEPWTAFLGLGRDSRIFQDKSVFDILEAVFHDYNGKGRLAPAWRFEIRDRDAYPQRSITTQYQESDLAFVERLMLEEGLFTYFEHQGDPGSAEFGSHTLVIADHNGAFLSNVQADVRYTQPGTVMEEDSIDRWRVETRLQTNAVELASWDYRSRQMRSVASNGDDSVALTGRDVPGAYAYPSTEQGQRIADNQLHAYEARKEVYVGAGTVRTFAPGTTFTLHDHDRFEGRSEASFAILRVCHLAHNNLDADTDNALVRLLGQCPLRRANDADFASSIHAVGRGVGERPVYRNRIDAIRSSVPYRPSRVDGHGNLLHPRPVVQGQQTAIVVGPPGSNIHTDRDHRVKVQFHWQRGEASHSRLDHPSPDSHTGAPADDRAGIWVRVATPLAPVAGANWGSHALPRVGQEVLIDFLDGNIDRPVVIGAVYNGAGGTDAQHNEIAAGGGAATGNAPAWFPGEAGSHAHPAVLSGLKSQAMGASQGGTGAYSQLVFDDSPAQPRVALQRHAKAHRGTAELNLGHLVHQTDNQRLDAAGFGAELKTENAAAVRAGMGMLLTADRAGEAAAHLDSTPAARQIDDMLQLQSQHSATAQKHNAKLVQEPDADKLPVNKAVKSSLDAVQGASTSDGSGAAGRGSATAYSTAHMQLSAPSGIAALTPASAVVNAGDTSMFAAGQDVNLVAQRGSYHGTRTGISLFTYGKANNATRPARETGICLHAASGRVSTQSQSGATRITANKLVTVTSVANQISVAAKERVLMTAQGAYLKIAGGNIQVHGPGRIEFKGSMKELAGPMSSSANLPLLPRSEGEEADQHFVLKSHSGKPIPNRRYRARTASKTVEGFTDEAGRTELLAGYLGQAARFELVDTTHDEHFIIRDPLGEPVAHMPYRIRSASGVEMTGTTDELGRTSLFTSDKIEKVELLYVDAGHAEDDGVN